MRFPVRLCTRSALDALDYSPRKEVSACPGYYLKKCFMNILEVKKRLTVADWTKLYQLCPMPGFGYQAFNSLMSKDSGLSEIRKLISALELSKSLNPVLKAQMMPGFEAYSKYCTEQDQKFVLDTCDEVMSQFPVLTREVGNLLLRGLIITPFWKERGEHITSNIKESVDEQILSTLANGAFLHGDFGYGWQLMLKAVPIGKNLHPKLYNRILDSHVLQPQQNLLFKLLEFLEQHSYMLPLSAAVKMSDILEKSNNWVARFTDIKLSGHCGCCNRNLKRISLTVEEHRQLLRKVEDAFDLNNEYTTYEKQEVSEFKTFLKKCPPYTVVLDGPNVFYRSSPSEKIIKQLEKRGHKILVICRYHMKKHGHFQSAFKGHLFYYVKNKTKDDTFTIYAALSSSPETLVVSNDYFGIYYSRMRGETRQLFRRWQLSTHVLGTGYHAQNLVFPEFSPLCQSSDDGMSMHIPLVSDLNWKAFAPSGWLCIQKVTKEIKQKSSKLWPKKNFILQDVSQVDSFRMYGKQLSSKPSKKEKSARLTQGV